MQLKIHKLILLFLGLFFLQCKAQSFDNPEISNAELNKYFGIPSMDSLLHQTDEDAQKFIITTPDILKPGSSDIAFHRARLSLLTKKIQNFAKANGYKKLQLQFALFEHLCNLSQIKSKEASLADIKKIHQKAKDENIPWAIIVSKYYLAKNYLVVQDDLPNGFLLLRETLDDIETYHFNRNSIRNILLGDLLRFYYMMGDYGNALIFGREALHMESSIKNGLDRKTPALKHTVNTLAIVYRKLNKLDSSNYYFNQIFQWAIQNNDSVWIALCNGNIGENLYLQKKYDAALPMLQIDAEFNYATSDFGPASNAYLLMANTYLKKGDIQYAEKYLKKGTECLRKYEHFSSIEKCKRLKLLYETLTQYYIATKNSQLAQMYFDSSMIFMDSIVNMRSVITSVKTEGIFQLNKSENQKLILRLGMDAAKKKQYIYLMLFVIVLLSAMFGFSQYRHMAKLKHARLQLEKEKVEVDLTTARDELKKYILQLASMSLPNENDVNWKETTILTQEHRQKFQELFEKSYPYYVQRAKEKMPGITEAELRFLCLLKVNLNITEIAKVLGVNKNTIHQTRGRLRKKFNLDNNVSFTDIVNEI